MPEIHLQKNFGVLAPADEQAEEIIKGMKHGQVMRVKFTLPRNYKFLKKYFALLKVGYDNWTPGKINSKYGVPEKDFGRFRADVIILAGYYTTTVRLDGSVRIEPKSTAFANMTEEEFSTLYSKTIDVLLKHVYGNGMTPEELNQIVERYLSFA
jgi:hypothetical protein